MKKAKKKRVLCLFMAAIMLLSLILSIASTAFAAEVTASPETTQIKNGCAVTISVIDQSGGYPGDAIKVIFKASDKEEVVELTKENTWGTSQPVTQTLPAPAQYSISFEGLEKGYKIVDTTTKNSVADSFKANSESSKFFGWAIVTEEQLKAQSQGKSKKETNESIEAQKLYAEFLEDISFIESDKTWNDGFGATLNQYGEESFNHSTYSQWYADYVWDGSVEDYFALSAFEQFLWTETYTRLADAINSGWGYDYFFASKESYTANITDLVTGTFSGTDAEVVKEAYLKLMDWQYDHIIKHGEPFNFIRGRTYTEEMKTPYAVETKSETEDKEQVEESQKGKGIWDDTMDSLARNAVSIIVLLILGGASFIVYRIRKEKNYDEERH